MYTTRKYLLMQAEKNKIKKECKVYTTRKYLLMQARHKQLSALLAVYTTRKYLLLQAWHKQLSALLAVYTTHKYLLMQAHEIYGSIIQRKRQHISAYKNKKSINLYIFYRIKKKFLVRFLFYKKKAINRTYC